LAVACIAGSRLEEYARRMGMPRSRFRLAIQALFVDKTDLEVFRKGFCARFGPIGEQFATTCCGLKRRRSHRAYSDPCIYIPLHRERKLASFIQTSKSEKRAKK
jgi:hypothetical protein